MTDKNAPITPYRNVALSELSNLRWDNDGNLAQQTVYSVANNTTTYQTMRMLFWDEDDRLNLVAGDGYLSYYAYGYDGNRAIKMTGNAAIDQSGTLLNSTNLENITIYPSEYLTVTQAEYTKYYYAGGNRIASKIGTGGFSKMTRLCTQDLNLSGNTNSLFSSVLQQVINTANQPTDVYPVDVCGGYNVATEVLTNPLPNIYISNTSLNFTQNNLLQQFRQNLTNSVEPVYYFHSDHLGSASWITSGTGLPAQHLLYLPFGEHFVDERSTAYDERFTFTGKERDLETGYYYHGARFNSSDIGWLSVDPMADKYLEITPYHYCHWNPIKLVDMDGMMDENPPTEQYRISIENNNAIFKQKDGSIQKFDLQNKEECNQFLESLKNDLSDGSSILGTIAIAGENSKASFRLTNSKGKLDFKFYFKKFNGNQYVIPTQLAKIAKGVKYGGYVLGGLSAFISFIQAGNASNSTERNWHIADGIMGIVGVFLDKPGFAAALYYFAVIKNADEIFEYIKQDALDRADLMQQGYPALRIGMR